MYLRAQGFAKAPRRARDAGPAVENAAEGAGPVDASHEARAPREPCLPDEVVGTFDRVRLLAYMHFIASWAWAPVSPFGSSATTRAGYRPRFGPVEAFAETTVSGPWRGSSAAAMRSALLALVRPTVLPLSVTSRTGGSGGAGRRASRSSSQSA